MRKDSCKLSIQAGAIVLDTIMSSDRDTMLIAIPFVFLSLMSYLKLDALLVSSKGTTRRGRLERRLDEFGEPILQDPDGQLSGNPRPRK